MDYVQKHNIYTNVPSSKGFLSYLQTKEFNIIFTKIFHSNMYTLLIFEIFKLKPPNLISYIGVDILLAYVHNI
jgi:hypothetical protein